MVLLTTACNGADATALLCMQSSNHDGMWQHMQTYLCAACTTNLLNLLHSKVALFSLARSLSA